jgi:hypothetical protein
MKTNASDANRLASLATTLLILAKPVNHLHIYKMELANHNALLGTMQILLMFAPCASFLV